MAGYICWGGLSERSIYPHPQATCCTTWFRVFQSPLCFVILFFFPGTFPSNISPTNPPFSSSCFVSANCRLELNYAHAKGKRMIPLLLEADYSPNGWLGIMMGTRLYYDFSQVQDGALFSQRMNELFREVDSVLGSSRAQGEQVPLATAAYQILKQKHERLYTVVITPRNLRARYPHRNCLQRQQEQQEEDQLLFQRQRIPKERHKHCSFNHRLTNPRATHSNCNLSRSSTLTTVRRHPQLLARITMCVTLRF